MFFVGARQAGSFLMRSGFRIVLHRSVVMAYTSTEVFGEGSNQNERRIATPANHAAQVDPGAEALRTNTLPGRGAIGIREQGINQDRGEPPAGPGIDSPLVIAWRTVLSKLMVAENGEKQRLAYDQELASLEKSRGDVPNTLLAKALSELGAASSRILATREGGIANPREVGESFEAVYKLVRDKMDVSVAVDVRQLTAQEFPLSEKTAGSLAPIVQEGHAVIVMVAKEPPQSAAFELRRIAEEKFGGVISLWQHRELWDQVGASPELQDYLRFATVRVLTTAKDPSLAQLARGVNTLLEREGGFEDSQWIAIVKSVTQGDRHHALKEALMVCGPVVLGVKALESFAPGLMHSVGGALDDLFGAILPDVSQSMGKKGAPFSERFKEAWPVLKAGVASLPVAMGCGWLAATLHASSSSVAMHAVSGALFALACSLGTVGTSIGAYAKASRALEKLRSDEKIGSHIENLGTWGRTKLALQESIFDVPFRVGHTVIGVPLQFALGISAGIGGFFHNGLFVMAEGMLETVLGAGTAFGYPVVKSAYDKWRLKRV